MVADLLKNERLKEKGILPFHRLVETNLKFNRRLEKNRDLVNKRSLERGISNVQRYGRIYKSYSVNENSGRDRLNTEWAPGIIISSGLTRFLPAELCFRSGIYSCTVRARWLIIELESHVHFPPVFSRAPPPCSCFSNGTPRPSMTPLRRQKILFLPLFIPDFCPTWWFFFVSRIQAQHGECIISSHQSCLVFVSNNLNILSREIYI